MRGDDSETLRLSRDRAGGVDTQKKKTIAKNNIWQENNIFTVQRTNHRYNCLMMPTQSMISIFASKCKGHYYSM